MNLNSIQNGQNRKDSATLYLLSNQAHETVPVALSQCATLLMFCTNINGCMRRGFIIFMLHLKWLQFDLYRNASRSDADNKNYFIIMVMIN